MHVTTARHVPNPTKRGRIVTLLDYLVGPLVFLNSLVLLLELQIEGGLAGAGSGIAGCVRRGHRA